MKRRIIKNKYSGGVLSSTRSFFYSSKWQVLEERVDNSTNVDRQFVWGERYVDDLILRDRNTTGGETLNERLYGINDPNWNLTAMADTTGTVQERYGYDAYGIMTVMTPWFVPIAASLFDWEIMYAGNRWDSESGLYQVRNRVYIAQLGSWLQRDPLGLSAGINLYEYVNARPLSATDPSGLQTIALGAGGLANFGALAARLSAILASNPVTALVAVAVACIVQPGGALYNLIQCQFKKVFNDKYCHCVMSCQLGKCLGTLLAYLIGEIKEFIIDWLIREKILGTGSFDQGDRDANIDGLACAGGLLSALPGLSLVTGGVASLVQGNCDQCCREKGRCK